MDTDVGGNAEPNGSASDVPLGVLRPRHPLHAITNSAPSPTWPLHQLKIVSTSAFIEGPFPGPKKARKTFSRGAFRAKNSESSYRMHKYS